MSLLTAATFGWTESMKGTEPSAWEYKSLVKNDFVPLSGPWNSTEMLYSPATSGAFTTSSTLCAMGPSARYTHFVSSFLE